MAEIEFKVISRHFHGNVLLKSSVLASGDFPSVIYRYVEELESLSFHHTLMEKDHYSDVIITKNGSEMSEPEIWHYQRGLAITHRNLAIQLLQFGGGFENDAEIEAQLKRDISQYNDEKERYS